jgi:hypothetical protein
MNRTMKSVSVVVVATAVVSSVGIAVAAVPSGGVISSCVSPTNGGVRIIDSSAQSCKSSEQALSWNQTGPQGQQGIQGPQGETGRQGETGAQGRDGFDGAPGTQGAPGSPGATGRAGADGKDGAPGPAGPAGQGVTALKASGYGAQQVLTAGLFSLDYDCQRTGFGTAGGEDQVSLTARSTAAGAYLEILAGTDQTTLERFRLSENRTPVLGTSDLAHKPSEFDAKYAFFTFSYHDDSGVSVTGTGSLGGPCRLYGTATVAP